MKIDNMIIIIFHSWEHDFQEYVFDFRYKQVAGKIDDLLKFLDIRLYVHFDIHYYMGSDHLGAH